MIVSPKVKTSWLEGTRDTIDAAGQARLVLITGDRDTGSMLSEHPLSVPCGTVKNLTLTFGAIGDDASARTSGKPSWARIYNGARRWVMDLEVGTEVTVPDFIEKGQTVKVVSGRLKA